MRASAPAGASCRGARYFETPPIVIRGWVGAFSAAVPPSCVTVKVVPPTCTVAVRFWPVLFTSVVKVNDVVEDFSVSHVAAVAAVHVQLGPLVTVTVPELFLPSTIAVDEPSVYVHCEPGCVTATV
jgi:hypothetical protein